MKNRFVVYAIMLVTVAMFFNLSVIPASAKPYQLVVSLKDVNHRPTVGIWVTVNIHMASGPDQVSEGRTDDRGKFIVTMTPGYDYVSFDVRVTPAYQEAVTLATNIELSKNMGARIALTYP